MSTKLFPDFKFPETAPLVVSAHPTQREVDLWKKFEDQFFAGWDPDEKEKFLLELDASHGPSAE